MRQECFEALYALAKDDERIVLIGADSAGDAAAFRTRLPERFFLEGIGEANAVGMAAGMALDGRVPFVTTIASFLTRRAFEQIVVDLGLQKAKVRLLGVGGGLVYAPLGPTHLATDDFAILRVVPGMTIVAPADVEELSRLLPQTVDRPGPVYVRLARGGEPVVSRPSKVKIGQAVVAREGKDAMIVTTGLALRAGLEAAEELAREGLDACVLHCHTVKPLDRKAILERARRCPIIVTVEEHSIVGGLGSAVAEIVAEAGFSPCKGFKRLGIPDAFAGDYGSQASLAASFGLTGLDVARAVKQLARRR